MIKYKGISLIETTVVIAIISILLTIIVQILLNISKYNKRVGYIQEADIKTKEIAIKIEKILYSKDFLNLKIINDNILAIYSIKDNKTYVELYYNKTKIGSKYYRKVSVIFDKTNRVNSTYLPDNVFWKIENNIVFLDNQQMIKEYIYNFDNTPPIKIRTLGIDQNYYNAAMQNLSIGFYIYLPDPKGREFSKYVKDPNWKNYPYAKGMLVYFINIINVRTY